MLKSYKRDEGKTQFSWKGAAIQRKLEHEKKELAIVRSRYQETSSEDTSGWRRLIVCCTDL
jgi:hypothetical protein